LRSRAAPRNSVVVVDIRQLETFLRIVDNGSFAAAAEALAATQSTVSARVRELEKSLGVELFDRSQHRARLTAKGHELVAPARQIVGLAQQLRHRVGDPQALTGMIRIGVVGLVAITWLSRLLQALRSRYPNVSAVIEVALTATLLERLRNGDVDLAIVTGPVLESSLRTVFLGRDRFVWMASPQLDLPTRRLSPRELAAWPILSLSAQSHHYPVIEQWFASNDVEFRPVISCSNIRVLADLTLDGPAVSLLPERSYAQEVGQGRLRILDTEPELRPVDLVALHRLTSTEALISAVVALAQETSGYPTRD
jgi:DNA-binding transcriptional LysR family regulator